MPPRYRVNVRDHTGLLQAQFDTWSDQSSGLQYTKSLDNIGAYSFAIALNDSRREYFVKDAFIEIQRSDTDHGVGWYTDFIGLHRDREKIIDDVGRQLFVSKGPDLNHLLKRRYVLYFSDDPLATQDTFADDAMKLFVEQNAGDLALAPPRMKDGVFPNFNVEPQIGAAPIWSGTRPFTNLFDVVHEIALAAQTDFQITLDSWSPLSMTFRTYYPFLGKDRTPSNVGGNSPAVFSPRLANLTQPHYTETSSSEITSVIVLGQGSQSDREFSVIQADGVDSPINTINDSPWNDIEKSTNQSQDGLVQSLDQAGLYELQHDATKTDLQFRVLMTSSLVYGRDWGLGDQITYTFDDADGPVNKRVTGITVQESAGTHDIQPSFTELQ